MTFYEAAIQILEQEGRPLHAHEITERALEQNLLSHVGQQPHLVMASRLAAMARKSQDRRLVAVAPDTFGLSEWNLQSDPDALEKSGIVPEPEEASQPPLRGPERHPKISKENVRIMGRGERRRREERRARRAPKDLAELVQAILAHAGTPLPLFDLAAAIRDTEFVDDDLGRETLRQRLAEANEKLEQEERAPVFYFLDEGLVGLEGMEAPSEPADAPRLIDEALARLIRPKAQVKEAAAAAPAPAATPIPAPTELQAQSWQHSVQLLRARLLELSTEPLEGITLALLEEMGYREIRVAKRQKEGSLFVAKRRMGLTEIRWAVRVLRGGREVRRDDVLELRKDLQSHSAHIGVVVSPADPTREARAEAARPGQGAILLLCADALAEQLAARRIGVATRTVEIYEFDPRVLAGRARRALRTLGRSAAEESGEAQQRAERRSRRGRRQEVEGTAAAQPAGTEAAATGGSAEKAPPTEGEKAPDADAGLVEAAEAHAEKIAPQRQGEDAAERGTELPASASDLAKAVDEEPDVGEVAASSGAGPGEPSAFAALEPARGAEASPAPVGEGADTASEAGEPGEDRGASA